MLIFLSVKCSVKDAIDKEKEHAPKWSTGARGGLAQRLLRARKNNPTHSRRVLQYLAEHAPRARPGWLVCCSNEPILSSSNTIQNFHLKIVKYYYLTFSL